MTQDKLMLEIDVFLDLAYAALVMAFTIHERVALPYEHKLYLKVHLYEIGGSIKEWELTGIELLTQSPSLEEIEQHCECLTQETEKIEDINSDLFMFLVDFAAGPIIDPSKHFIVPCRVLFSEINSICV